MGNNPFVISVPNKPYPVLLDMAMSQFSYGKMEVLHQRGEKLPFAGGFDKDHKLTDEPGEILDSELALPAGYWKGSGLVILIDLLVSTLSGGLTTKEIGGFEEEHGLSQLFIAFDLQQISDPENKERIIKEVTGSLLESTAMVDGGHVFCPGQQTWLRRKENERKGIPVDRDTWDVISAL